MTRATVEICTVPVNVAGAGSFIKKSTSYSEQATKMNIRRNQKADEGNSSSADHCNRNCCCNSLLKRGAVIAAIALAAAATPAAYAVSPKPLTSSSLIGATGNVGNSRFSPLRFLQGTEVHDDHDLQHHDDHKDELHVEVSSL